MATLRIISQLLSESKMKPTRVASNFVLYLVVFAVIAFTVSADESVCGNSIVEVGEECDGGVCCSVDCLFITSTVTILGEDLWDSWVYEYSFNNWDKGNHGGGAGFQVGTRTTNNDAKGRTYLKAILDDIPAGSDIVDASLQVYFPASAPLGCSFSMAVNRVVTGNWAEGAGIPSGGFEPTAVWPDISWFNQQFLIFSSSDKVVFNPSVLIFTNINITDFVKNWYNGVWSNYGLVMKRDVEGTSELCVFTSISREYPGLDSLKPRLVVTYMPESCASESTCNNDGVVDPGEQCDGGVCCRPDCTFSSAATECRASNGDCDTAESCSGLSATCPQDLKSTQECRASAGGCDGAEYCDGISDDCPSDLFLPETTECRAAAGDCDEAEYCNGISNSCPEDSFAPEGTSCDDESSCTQDDVCSHGVCGGTTAEEVCGDGVDNDCDHIIDEDCLKFIPVMGGKVFILLTLFTLILGLYGLKKYGR